MSETEPVLSTQKRAVCLLASVLVLGLCSCAGKTPPDPEGRNRPFVERVREGRFSPARKDQGETAPAQMEAFQRTVRQGEAPVVGGAWTLIPRVGLCTPSPQHKAEAGSQ